MRKILAAIALLALSAGPVMAQSAVRSGTNVTNLLVTGVHTLNGFTVIAPSGGRVIALDSATVPADGAVVPAGCWLVPSVVAPDTATMISMANTSSPTLVQNGLLIMFSTGVDCSTLVKSSAEFMLAIYQ